MKKNSDDFLMDKIEVNDSTQKKVFSAEAARNYVVGGRKSGNVFVLCLNDDLRDHLGKALAEKLDRKFIKVDRSGGAPAVIEAAENDNQIVSLPRGAALAQKNRERLKNNGQVIFIMCDFTALLQATDGSEDSRNEISILLNRFEPHFMNTAHHIIRGDQSFEEMVQDALEKIAM